GPNAELVIWCQDGATGALNAGSAEEIYASTLEDMAGIGVTSADGAGGVVVNGGVITCYGGKNAAGLGGGPKSGGGTVVVNNGTVTATGGEGGAGIGCGAGAGVAHVSIMGGTVTATGGEGAAGIGGSGCTLTLSWTHDGDSITASSYACNTLELRNDFKFSDGTAGVTNADVLGSSGKTLVPVTHIPSFKTMSLVLSGQIGVNFFMDLPAIDGVDYTQSYMEFMVGERKAARADYDVRKKSEDGLYYGFTCYVSSIQMAEPITATFHYGDGQAVTCTNISVENYARSFEKDAHDNPGKYSEEAVNLVHAIADYGYYVQPFLSAQNGWTIGTDYAAMNLCYNDAYDVDGILSSVSSYTCSISLGESGLTNVSVRLNLNSSTTLEILFTVPEGYNVEIDEDAYEAKKVSATRWRVSVPNIPAHKLGDNVTVNGQTNGGPFSITASPLAYVNMALTSNVFDSVGKTALCSFYKYYEAARTYRSTLNL
ncbi:MAG: hypothetical protein UHS51_03710, partial [Atopobiaceae bacterium]|nr:hypothetical protein [Atopobiaceae bacterium]